MTLHIGHFYLNISHDYLRDSLSHFFNKYLAPDRLESLSIIHIQDLIELFFKYLLFYYKQQLYQLRKGLPHGLCLSETLATIFLFQWQSTLYHHSSMKNELFGRSLFFSLSLSHMFFLLRYQEMYFFTYHGNDKQLRSLLSTVNEHYPDLSFNIIMNKKIQFLEMNIENRHGHLYTSIDHDTKNNSSYVLPYVNGHTQLIYAHYFQTLMIRAVRYCSNVEDFNRERLYIEMTYLFHGFPYVLIEYFLKEFYNRFHMSSLQTNLDRNVYHQCRKQCLACIDQEQIRYEQNEQWKNNNKLIQFIYSHEWGRRCHFDEEFRQLWSRYIYSYPMFDNGTGKIHLTTKSIHSLNSLLARTKPLDFLSNKH